MSKVDATNKPLCMTFGELLEIGEMTCTLSDGDEPIAVMAVIKGRAVCREVLDVIAKYEEVEDDD